MQLARPLEPRQLTNRITTATDVYRLSSLLEQHGSSFNHVHVAAAITRLPKLAVRHRSEPEAQQLLQQLSQRFLQHVHTYSEARQYANVLWAISKLHKQASEPQANGSAHPAASSGSGSTSGRVVGAIEAELMAEDCKKLRRSIPQELSNIAYGLAVLGHDKQAAIWQPVSSAAQQSTQSFKPQELANLLWAYAKVGRRDTPLFSIVVRAAVGKLPAFKPQELSNLLWACAAMRYRDPELLEEAARQLTHRLWDCNSQDLGNIAWAYGRLRYYNQAFFTALCGALHAKADAMQPQEMSNAIWACAAMQHYDVEWFSSATRRLKAGMGQFSTQSISNIVYACAKLNHPDPALAAQAAEYAAASGRSFRSQELVVMLWSLAKQQGCDRVAERPGPNRPMQALLSALKPQLAECQQQELALSLWSCVQLTGCRPSLSQYDAAFVDAACQAALGKLPSFTPQHLCVTAHSLAKLRHMDPFMFNGVAEALAPKLASCSPQVRAAVGQQPPLWCRLSAFCQTFARAFGWYASVGIVDSMYEVLRLPAKMSLYAALPAGLVAWFQCSITGITLDDGTPES